jgi:hypothetical protein
MLDRDRAGMSEYWKKLAAALRYGVDGMGGVPGTPEPMPDLQPSPDLLKIIAMAKEGTRGVIDLDDRDWEILLDETLYQIARALHRDESIVVPSLGKLEIVYGEGGSFGRLTLDEAARPEVML